MPITLRRIVQQVSAATSLDEALTIIVQQIRQAITVDVCSVYLSDRETHRYVLVAADGSESSPAAPEQARPDRYAGLIELVGERQEPVNLQQTMTHPRYAAATENTENPEYPAFLGVPLIYYRRVLGVLVVQKRVAQLFDKDEVAFLITLAARLAHVIFEAAALDDVNRLLSGEGPEDAFIQGIQGAPGIAIGTVALLDPLAALNLVPDRPVQNLAAEEAAFAMAVSAVQDELHTGSARLAAELPCEALALFDFYLLLLESDSLIADTLQRIRAGNWAPGAWRDTIAERTQRFEQMEDPYLRARAEDIRNVGRHLLSQLKIQLKAPVQYPQRCILMGDTISIADMAAVPVEQLAGIVSHHGSAFSHAAVLARALSIPAVVSLAALPVERLDGSEIVVDGNRGRIYVRPSATVVAAVHRQLSEEQTLTTQLQALRDLPAIALDGARLALYANIGLMSELAGARSSGAEGIGLFRTEFIFLMREAFPSEDEQYEIYREMLQCFAPAPVTLRTLDIGGDKILPYFPIEEENPFLGCRGIRFTLDHPEILLIQMRAMLRANAGLNNLQMLFPMISRVGEIDEALGLLARAYRELLDEGQAAAKPTVGAMIEVPSAVYLASALSRRLDFLSIGTNDLTQYLLAVDRNNAQVATPYDSLHPAVINAVRQVIEDAHRQGKPVSVCGEMAGEPAAALLLLGMGVDALSMNPSRFAHVKRVIRGFTRAQAYLLLNEALTMEDGFAIDCLLNGALKEAGVTGVFTTTG
jgi:phosphotransferase system enzyme I (PtsP)